MNIQQLGKKSIKLDWDKGEYPVIFRDFAGKGDMWTQPGKPTFCLSLLEDQLELFKSLGYANMKELKKRDPDDPDEMLHYRLKVKVLINGMYPPEVYYIKKGVKTPLDAESIGILDKAIIEEGEMCIVVSPWEYGQTKGVNLILSSATFVVGDRNFTGKYDNIPMFNEEEPMF